MDRVGRDGRDVLAVGFAHAPVPALRSMFLYGGKGMEVSFVERHGVFASRGAVPCRKKAGEEEPVETPPTASTRRTTTTTRNGRNEKEDDAQNGVVKRT